MSSVTAFASLGEFFFFVLGPLTYAILGLLLILTRNRENSAKSIFRLIVGILLIALTSVYLIIFKISLAVNGITGKFMIVYHTGNEMYESGLAFLLLGAYILSIRNYGNENHPKAKVLKIICGILSIIFGLFLFLIWYAARNIINKLPF